MMTSDLTKLVPENHTLRVNQQLNVSSLLDISRSFARNAEYECDSNPSVQDDILILESGHQPNFFPYSGVWKKVFLLDQFRKMLASNGDCGIAFFGFADQNATTAPFLYKNQVPALNKTGMQKIGFTVKGSEKWKRFDTLKKPLPEVWEEEMLKMKNLSAGTKSELPAIMEIMWKSYERADSFSDLNGYIFSRISREILGFDVHFFRYSDIHRNQLFSDECKQILEKMDCYQTVYNDVIRNKNIPSRQVVSGEVPFWYHCDCGGKIPLMIDSFGICRGECPICKNEYELDFDTDFSRFDAFSQNMSFSAVSRNLVFSEGLGTHIFVSGAGGGLRYGKISDAISSEIGFNKPLTCSWSSKDYYLGKIHANAVKELQKMFSLTKEEVLDVAIDELIRKFRENMEQKITEMEAEGADNKSIRLYRGRFLGSAKTAEMVSRVFSTIPSMFDLYLNFDREEIVKSWVKALDCSVQEKYGSTCIISQDVVYDRREESGFSPDEIPVLYGNMSAIGVKN
ncbi:hypothetical protein L1S32_03095 [Methanogenium sp. S4BF]|uniref:hypothetical protein n=1 Tax=Methanogenium sp. S4BF TaxID=1789226 RepID=UPI002417F030|nr:hypothetical protein [Methanogenium sp. S4BF]WFN35118.1 hypothetical protein L1S32_03095 [Methanogenium sp. S4BF]